MMHWLAYWTWQDAMDEALASTARDGRRRKVYKSKNKELGWTVWFADPQ